MVESDGGGFDGGGDGGGYYGPFSYEEPSLRGCLLNVIKLVIILILVFFVFSKYF